MARRSPRGAGSTFQRKTGPRAGQWVGQLDLGWTATGRRYKQFTGATQKDVLEKLQKAQRELSEGALAMGPRQTLRQYLEHWLENTVCGKVRPSTYASYELNVRKHIGPTIGRVQLAKLTPQHVESFLNDRQRNAGLSPRTVQYLHAILRKALEDAEKKDLVGRNVAKRVSPPPQRQSEISPLTPDEARRLLEQLRGDRLEALYSVALALGLRRGEALGLQWSDIDLDARVLRVRKSLQTVGGVPTLVETKTRKSVRTIDLPAMAVRALREHRLRQLQEHIAAPQWEDHDFVFTSTRGTPLDGRNVLRHLQAALEAAGLPRKRFHDLRHTAASLLLAQGESLSVIKEILGHSQISLTANLYAHVLPSLRRQAADRMDEILGDGSV